jgi:cell division protein FtsL
MIKRTVVLRKSSSCDWQPKIKRNINKKRINFSGFISPLFIVLGCTVFAGLLYLFSINSTAVKGIEIREIEKEIAQMQKEKESLKIKEAELKSLYKIEQSSKDLNMSQLKNVQYIDESPQVAIKFP